MKDFGFVSWIAIALTAIMLGLSLFLYNNQNTRLKEHHESELKREDFNFIDDAELAAELNEKKANLVSKAFGNASVDFLDAVFDMAKNISYPPS